LLCPFKQFLEALMCFTCC